MAVGKIRRSFTQATALIAVALNAMLAASAVAQSSSVSAWSAADFRIWGFVPNWATQTQINNFSTNGSYDHVSDVLYFGGVQPKSDGSLYYASTATGHINALKSAAVSRGFALHSSMFTVNGGTVDDVWNAIVSNPTTRATFVNNVKNFLVANNMKGYNLDWERPDTDAEWSNYTQLAKDLRTVLKPLGIEVSVDDYGYADSDWDDTAVFDAGAAYDQLFIMGYHYGASSNATFANTKLALTGQGASKAFKNEQLVLGIGTWGADGPATVSMEAIAAANPNLPYDALTFTGTINDIGGVSRTGTWNIESRKQVREKVQLALDRNMPGVMSWTLHYDAKNKLSLHRVAQHYAMFKREIPDLNLDGKVNAADANALADNMGTVPGWKGTATAAQFENFYMSGNWEKGDRDGNGFVNQADANWLVARYNTLGVALPDRLAYTGSFEKFNNAVGLNGRWNAGRNLSNQIEETGNFTQHNANTLTFAGTGAGANKYRNTSVTIRNQNSAEAFDLLNTAPRTMHAELTTPIDLAAPGETYVTFLVRQNSAGLLASQLSSANRTLSLELLNEAGVSQYDFSFHGQQTDFSIRSQADAAGADVQTDGFAADATYLFVGKLAGNGAGANTLQASLFANGANVANFADPQFQWMLTAAGGADFNPLITDLQFKSLFEGSFTVSNLWVGGESDFFAAPIAGDFNADGIVEIDDLDRWQAGVGIEGNATHWQGDANGDQIVDGVDLLVWQRNFGMTSSTVAAGAVPEPNAVVLAAVSLAALAAGTRAALREPNSGAC
jgi:GH18 family chitinase